MIPTLLLALLPLPAPPAGASPDPAGAEEPVLRWADRDGDGDLDLLVLRPDGSLALFDNEGESGFAETTLAAGLADLRGVRDARWGALGGDGAPDLVLATAGGVAALVQTGGAFADAAPELGLADAPDARRVTWLDVDGDGVEDLWVAAAGGHRLFERDGRGAFRELALPLDVLPAAPAVRTAPALPPAPGEAPVGASSAASDDAGARPRVHADLGGVAGRLSPGAPSGPATTAGPELVEADAPTLQSPQPAPAKHPRCAACLQDVASPGDHVQASSAPQLGYLYPLSQDLYVDSSGYVGMGTTTPSARLHVEGQVLFGTDNLATGFSTTILGGNSNTVQGNRSTILGGQNNEISSSYGAVAGGEFNSILGGGDAEHSFVGGGRGNTVDVNHSSFSGGYCTIAGGNGNDITNMRHATISGGSANTIDALENPSSKFGATIAGGTSNTVNESFGTVSGGFDNEVGGKYATIPGGDDNAATGDWSMAAGRRAEALHDGAFVWGDSADATLASTAPDQFLVRAGGGVGVGTNAPQAALHVVSADATAGLEVVTSGAGDDPILRVGNPGDVELEVRSSGDVLIDGDVEAGGSFLTGDAAGVHTVYADGAIQHRDAASTPFPLLLNPEGGDVGFGTLSPEAPVHVASGSDVSASGGSYLQIGSATATNLAFDNNEIMARSNGAAATLNLNFEGGPVVVGNGTSVTNVRGQLGVGTSSPAATLHVEESSTDDPLRVRVSGDTKLIVTNSGNVGIEGAAPTEKLDVAGNVRCVSLIETSDARYKQDVQGLEDALETVLALRGVSYVWDRAKLPQADPGRKLGFLAQELRRVLPEAVKEGDDGYLSVSYSSVVPVLVEAVRELDARVSELDARVAALVRR